MLLLTAPSFPAGGSASASGSLAFSASIRLGPLGGYEPGIKIDDAGTIFVTAHKLNVTAEARATPAPYARTASWLWVSRDGGLTFNDLTIDPLVGANRYVFGDEGDLALDDAGHLYWVDTNVVDDVIARFSDHGQATDVYRPLMPSLAPVDDRPWIAASGSSYLYYLANVGYGSWFQRSIDGGLTFEPSTKIMPSNGFCTIAAERSGPHVVLLCDNGYNGDEVIAWTSSDHGATLQGPIHVAERVKGYKGGGWDTVGIGPDGTVYGVYNDCKLQDGSKIHLVVSKDFGATWTDSDVTPRAAYYEFATLAAGPTPGTVALAWYSTAVATGSRWIAEVAIVQSASTATPIVSVAQASPGYVSTTGDFGLGDFFQVAFGPDGRLNVVYDHVVKPPLYVAAEGGDIRIMYSRETSGPNLGP